MSAPNIRMSRWHRPEPTAVPLLNAATWSRWLIVGTVVVSGGHLFGVTAITAPMALVVAGLAFLAGIPHGAIDHLMAQRLSGGTPLPAVAAVYASAAAAAWALLQWAGPIALVAAALFSAVHFGLGELEVSRLLTGWQPGRIPAAAIVVAGSGALVLPLARAGDQLLRVATAVSPELAVVISAASVQVALLSTWFVAASVAVAAALRSGHRAVALDIVLIGALGMMAPPLVAFAIWFGCWHALRHTARMLTVEPGCAALLDDSRGRAAIWRLVRLAALPSLAALTTVVALGWFTVASPNPTTMVAEVLRLLLALTVPHMVVVWWFDSAPSREVYGPGARPSTALSPSKPRRRP
ncbi:MAG: beta-carotene 15,15'-dioxygenase, Brp/Blh family [Rhodococcus sp. (in: high G+C Gram-positive bacteria)]